MAVWRGSALLVGFLLAPCIEACSCIGTGAVCSSYWTTPLVFLGHVVRQESAPQPGEVEVHFAVQESLRGEAGEEVVVSTNLQGSACGFRFERGQDYLVYAYKEKDAWTTEICTRTHKVEDPAADADLRWIHGISKMPPGGSIFGVVNTTQPTTAIPGTKLTITGPVSKTLVSDGDGKFSVSGLTPGKYSVSATAPTGYSSFEPYHVTLVDRGCAETDFATRVDGHVRGTVLFADGKPAGGVFISLEDANGNPKEPWSLNQQYGTTKSDGSFDFGLLPAASYILAINPDFSASEGQYYRKAFYPGVTDRKQASAINLGVSQVIDDLHFSLPPDLAAPSIPLQVTFLGADGHPIVNGSILAEDDIWEHSVTSISGTTSADGKATLLLRPAALYHVWAFASREDNGQMCAEPVAVTAKGEPPPIVLVVTHNFGNCHQFKKPPSTR